MCCLFLIIVYLCVLSNSESDDPPPPGGAQVGVSTSPPQTTFITTVTVDKGGVMIPVVDKTKDGGSQASSTASSSITLSTSLPRSAINLILLYFISFSYQFISLRVQVYLLRFEQGPDMQNGHSVYVA